jgi:hypothetical protein
LIRQKNDVEFSSCLLFASYGDAWKFDSVFSEMKQELQQIEG